MGGWVGGGSRESSFNPANENQNDSQHGFPSPAKHSRFKLLGFSRFWGFKFQLRVQDTCVDINGVLLSQRRPPEETRSSTVQKSCDTPPK